jgi:hypothetical protein
VLFNWWRQALVYGRDMLTELVSLDGQGGLVGMVQIDSARAAQQGRRGMAGCKPLAVSRPLIGISGDQSDAE